MIIKTYVTLYAHSGQQRERHRSRIDLGRTDDFVAFKKRLVAFLGIKALVQKLGFGAYELKLFRMAKTLDGKVENYAILTGEQWALERDSLLDPDTQSELNGKPIFRLRAVL